MGNAVILNRSITHLLASARLSLGLNQEKLGSHLGTSKRTLGRCETGHANLHPDQVCTLARLVHPINPAMAAELAAAASESLESLGLVVPAPAKAPASVAAPPSPALPSHLIVDAVVCVAADALGSAPTTVRAALYAAFKRARELRLTLEDVEKALMPAAVPNEGKASSAGKGPS